MLPALDQVVMAGLMREGRKVAPTRTPKPRDNEREDDHWDIAWATKPFVRFCSVMGLVPIGPDPLETGTDANQTYKMHLSYSVVVFSAFTALFCAVVQSRVSNNHSEKGATIESTVYVVWWLLSGVVSVASFSMLIARRKELQASLREMAEIASKLMPKDKNFLNKVRYLLYFEVGAVVCLVALSVGLLYEGRVTGQMPATSYEILFQLFSLCATFVMSLQFINQLLMLYQLLSLVNAEMSSIKGSFKTSHGHKKKTGWDDAHLEDFSEKEELATRIRRHAGYHFSLCHLGPRLNEVYGVLALLLAMFVLLDVAYQFYVLINSAIVGVDRDALLIRLGTILLWSCPKVVTLILLVAACEFVIDEADSTGVLVSEVLLKVKDHQARRELRLFSHQLLHTKVRFTACGFFTLDFSLLTSMTAAVVTHLVILVQFQLAGKSPSSCPCNGTNTTMNPLDITTPWVNLTGD